MPETAFGTEVVREGETTETFFRTIVSNVGYALVNSLPNELHCMDPELSRVLFTRILLLLQLGVSSVIMDHLASCYGISKKTLYKHVKNKEDLLEKSLEQSVAFIKSEL